MASQLKRSRTRARAAAPMRLRRAGSRISSLTAAARAAEKASGLRGSKVPLVVEMTSYHAAGGRLTIGQFVPGSGPPEVVVRLSNKERARKSEMIACFGSQTPVLANFGVDVERFTLSPRYDFGRPPHPGRLHYERLEWILTGEDWRLFASVALRELGLGGMTYAAPC